LDFESQLIGKANAAELLGETLARPSYRCAPLALGSNTDPYQPVEREQRITRALLEVLANFRHPVTIVTKSSLVLRDLDLLIPMAERRLVQVFVSVTTLDRVLARRLEPRAAAPQRRVETIRTLHQAGVRVGVLASPMIPGLNDHELERILTTVRAAGAICAGYLLVRLPHEVRPLFIEWLDRHYPDRKKKVLHRIQAMRGGRLNDPRFGSRMRGQGVEADLLRRRFEVVCRRVGLATSAEPLDSSQFRIPSARPRHGQARLDFE
jgi:DNA repair photolyase